MSRIRALGLSFVAIAASLAISTVASAALILPGQVHLPVAGGPGVVGGTVQASLTSPFSAPGAFSGSLTSQVVSGDLGNPFGGLTFVYTITHDGVAGTNSIGRFTVSDYLGFSTDVSYSTLVAGAAPGSADRSVDGDVMGFNFFPTALDPLAGFLNPNTTSRILVIRTNAQLFTSVEANLIDGAVTTAMSFAPAIPAPSAALLLLFGVGRSRRRR